MSLRVCFLCTHNSARSQMAEALLREDFGTLAGLDIQSFSAGVVARGVHPQAREVLGELGICTNQLQSKTVDALTLALSEEPGDGPLFDVVVTVCDNAREACPYLPGRLKNLHHSFQDPSALEGSDAERLQTLSLIHI